MNDHNIAQVIHLGAEPANGYTESAQVKVIYLDGSEVHTVWGSDADSGGVLAWRAEHGDDAATPYEAPAVTVGQIIGERERRLSLGFDYDFGDGRGVHHVGTTDADMKGWDEVSKVAQAAINLGQPSAPVAIVTDTGPVAITAIEWQLILIAAGQARQPIWAASFALQAMDPIPAGYADDQYWSN